MQRRWSAVVFRLSDSESPRKWSEGKARKQKWDTFLTELCTLSTLDAHYFDPDTKRARTTVCVPGMCVCLANNSDSERYLRLLAKNHMRPAASFVILLLISDQQNVL